MDSQNILFSSLYLMEQITFAFYVSIILQDLQIVVKIL